MRLDDEGQILVKGPDQFEGYWNQPDATKQIVDADEWLHTGDVGEWQNGNLRLIDRARDFMVTAGGKTISPSTIESGLRASPYISEAIVFGHGRKYLTALIEIDFDSVADWARAHDVNYTGFTSLVQNEAVTRLDQGGSRQGQRRIRASRADQELPHSAQGARSRTGRRAGDADPQGQAQPDV